MKSLVIGLGSIGQRHTDVLKSLGQQVFSVSQHQDLSSSNFHHLSQALHTHSFDLIVVANETHLHFQTYLELRKNLKYSGLLLMEKPLAANRPQENELDTPNEDLRSDPLAFVAYNLRFHPVVQKIKPLIAEHRPFASHLYVGQHLSLWRKNSGDFKKSYSASRARGGGVLRDLSHELDILHSFFGSPRSVVGHSTPGVSLGIEADDSLDAILLFESCKANVNLNLWDFETERMWKFFSKDLTIKANLVKGEIHLNQEIQKINFQAQDSYLAMHQSLLSTREGLCSWNEGLNVLKTIEALETSSMENSWVQL